MKKITPIILALLLLLGCKASLPTQVQDECAQCKVLYAKNICKPDAESKKVSKTDSAITADSIKHIQSLQANKDVVNSALNVYDVCDKWRYKYDSVMTREEKETFDATFTEAKAIHSKNIDRKCPDIPPYSRLDMDEYYTEAGVKDGKWYHYIFRKPHNVTIETTTIEQPIIVEPCSYTSHWYFWGFVILAVLWIIFIVLVILASYKQSKS